MTYPRLIHWLNFRQLCKALSEKILLHLELEKPSLCFLKKFICSFQMPIRNTVLTEWQIDTVSLQIWVINVLLFGQLYFQLETVRGQYLTQDFQAQTVEQRNSTVFSSLCSCCFVKKKKYAVISPDSPSGWKNMFSCKIGGVLSVFSYQTSFELPQLQWTALCKVSLSVESTFNIWKVCKAIFIKTIIELNFFCSFLLLFFLFINVDFKNIL